MRRAILAIDAGNSKTDVCVVSADGELLGERPGRAVPAAPRRAPPRPSRRSHAAVAEALSSGRVGRRCGTSPPAWPTPTSRSSTRPSRPRSREAGWAPSYEVVNDTFALLRAGLDAARGVAVVCGAGINCTGVLPDGTTARFAAVGHISGDWGGGGHLWQEAMWWAARAEDGRGPDTALRTALPAHFGLAVDGGPDRGRPPRRPPRGALQELTPLLFSVAEAGDRDRRRVVRRQADEVVALAATAIRRLGALSEPIDVVLGGGVLTAGHPLLMDEITRLLADQAPLARAARRRGAPIVGAALLGLAGRRVIAAARDRRRRATLGPVDREL